MTDPNDMDPIDRVRDYAKEGTMPPKRREDLLWVLKELEERQTRKNDADERQKNAWKEVERLRDGLSDAINFMKDAKKVSIMSRGIQLEAEFFGGV